MGKFLKNNLGAKKLLKRSSILRKREYDGPGFILYLCKIFIINNEESQFGLFPYNNEYFES